METEHAELAEAMDHLGTAISNVAASTPSGAPHAMVWVEKAKMAINAWRAKFMPQPEPVAEPEPEAELADPPVDEAGASDDQPAEDAPADPPAWSPPAA